MKERPILMSAPMVRALLAGTKTQTRRALKQQPQLSANHEPIRPESRGGHSWVFMVHTDRPSYQFATGDTRCPYGQPGDLLWVRETWAQNANQTSDTHIDRSILYRADGSDRALDNGSELPWRPSIFMPRALSRLTLRITKVRVHRLVDISEEDACAEGWPNLPGAPLRDAYPIGWYANLWDDINGRGSYEANPWVWALTFERVPLRDAAGG